MLAYAPYKYFAAVCSTSGVEKVSSIKALPPAPVKSLSPAYAGDIFTVTVKANIEKNALDSLDTLDNFFHSK